MKKFSTKAILSASTRKLCGSMGDVYEVCGYLTKRPHIMTHELPDCGDNVRDFLRKRMPHFSDLFDYVEHRTIGLTGDQFLEKINIEIEKFEKKHGSMHRVPMPKEGELGEIPWGRTLNRAFNG